MRLTRVHTLCFSSGYLSTEMAHPPNLQFQDVEEVTNWLSNEGNVLFFYFSSHMYIYFWLFVFYCYYLWLFVFYSIGG